MNQYLNHCALFFLIYFIKDIFICSLSVYIKNKKNKILPQQKKHQTTSQHAIYCLIEL